MKINLTHNGKSYPVEVAKPTFALKEKVRQITVEYIEALDVLDKAFKIPDDPKRQNPLDVIKKSNESEQISDIYTMKYFVAIADNIPEEIKQYFTDIKPKKITEFWQNQDISELQRAVAFFRNGK